MIGDAISKLESFQRVREPLQSAVEELLEKLKQLSPSAITCELIAGKEKEFEVSTVPEMILLLSE